MQDLTCALALNHAMCKLLYSTRTMGPVLQPKAHLDARKYLKGLPEALEHSRAALPTEAQQKIG